MSDRIGSARKTCSTVGVEWCKCARLSVCVLLQVWCWCGGYCNCGPFEWTRAGLHLHLPQTTEATQVRLQSFLSSSHPLYICTLCMCACMHLRLLQTPQLPYLCVLAMQVAASEETVPRCDEYSGCPSATAAKVCMNICRMDGWGGGRWIYDF